MRVALDLRWLQQAYVNSPDGGLGGIAAFSRNLWRGLAAARSEIELVALLGAGRLPPPLAQMIACTPGATMIRVGGVPGQLLEARGSVRLARRLLESEVTGLPALSRHRVDVLHTLDHTPPPRQADFATVVTVYDLLGVAAPPQGASFRQQLMARYHQASAARFDRASAVAPISETTAGELRQRFPHLATRIAVIPPGIQPMPVSDDQPGILQRRTERLPRCYFLHVGLLTPRKNPDGLIGGFAAWTSRHGRAARLLCVGPYEANPLLRDHVQALADHSGVGDLVSVMNAVSDVDLAILYRGAEALVFPSLAEGFGMPLAESLAYGTACVTSDQPVSHEAAGPLGVYVDPGSAEAIARGIERAGSEAHRTRVRREGPAWSERFSLALLAQRYIGLYRHSVNRES